MSLRSSSAKYLAPSVHDSFRYCVLGLVSPMIYCSWVAMPATGKLISSARICVSLESSHSEIGPHHDVEHVGYAQLSSVFIWCFCSERIN